MGFRGLGFQGFKGFGLGCMGSMSPAVRFNTCVPNSRSSDIGIMTSSLQGVGAACRVCTECVVERFAIFESRVSEGMI